MAPSLKKILEYFIDDVQSESTGCQYTLQADNDGMWFSRLQMFGKEAASWQVEQYMIASFIQIARICAGDQWLPSEIRISSTDTAQQLPYEWSQTRVTWGYKATEIKIPNHILALAPQQLETASLDLQLNSGEPSSIVLDLSSLIQTQILSKKINLDTTAVQTGLSPKTLKRRLANMNTSFTEVVEFKRLEIARTKLEKTDDPIYLIAEDLGYQHSANFIRAFKRLCNITSHEYRQKVRD
jgi:AraC-like DNA-binding protein